MLNIFYAAELPEPPVVTFGCIIFGFVTVGCITVGCVVSKPSEYGS